MSPLLFIVSVFLSPQAQAGELERAEHIRLQEEMARHAGRSAWSGVERDYQEMLLLVKKGEVLTHQDHYMGATAARGLGDMAACRARLQLAQEAEAQPETQQWLDEIASQYGEVELRLARKTEGALSAARMPFAQDQRKAIEVATETLSEERVYEGLLPVGDYSLGDRSFSVVATERVAIELGAARDPDEPYALSWAGLRASASGAWTSIGETQTAASPPGFSGMGARLGAGASLGLLPRWDGFAQLGYHNLLSPNGTYGDQLHLGYALMGVAWAHPRFRLGVGWSTGFGASRSVGLQDSQSVNRDCPFGSTEESCSWISAVPEDLRSSYPWAGRHSLSGLELELSLSLFELLGMDGGLVLGGGMYQDAERSYPWGQLGVLLTPPGPKGANP